MTSIYLFTVHFRTGFRMNFTDRVIFLLRITEYAVNLLIFCWLHVPLDHHSIQFRTGFRMNFTDREKAKFASCLFFFI